MSLFQSILWIVIALILSSYSQHSIQTKTNATTLLIKTSEIFSGYYTITDRQSEAERFAAAWLTTKDVFMQSSYIEKLRMAVNIESVNLALLNIGIPLLTRDYFDFQVLHLSTTTNLIPDLSNQDIQRQLYYRMIKTVEQFRNISEGSLSPSSSELLRKRLSRPKPRLLSTVVIIPYTSVPGTQKLHEDDIRLNEFTYRLRFLYLKACVYSVSRYFPKIIISTRTKTDLEAVQALDLPIWKYFDMSSHPAVMGNPQMLPRESLVYLYELLQMSAVTANGQQNNDWKSIKYVYYTEMDQILYARALPIAYDVLDRIKAPIIMVPHRLNTIALPKTFETDQVWKTTKSPGWISKKLHDLNRVQVIVEDAVNPSGSCCDDGRYLFEHCGTFWTTCPNYGIQNYSQWLRFGSDGFTTPSGSAHRAKCQYYPQKINCPLPKDCSEGIPLNQFPKYVCGEMPKYIIIPEFNRTRRFY